LKELALKESILAWKKLALARWNLLVRRLNIIRPDFLGKAGLADVLIFFYKGMVEPRFNLAAMAMAYRFFFAVFPGLILIFTLVPLVPIPDLKVQVMNTLSAIVPGDSMGFMDRVVDEFFAKPSAGLIYLNVGLLFFSTMSGIKVMMMAFSKETPHFLDRNFLKTNLVAFVLLLGLLTIFMGTIGLQVLQEYAVHYLIQHKIIQVSSWEATFIRILFWLVIYFALLLAVSLLYYFGPSTKVKGRFFSPGSIAGSILILVAVTAFRLFFSSFANYNKIYGSLGAIMLLMVWFYWISIVLLIGFELNAAILAAGGHGSLEVQEGKEKSPDKPGDDSVD
jgi:membrane protein